MPEQTSNLAHGPPTANLPYALSSLELLELLAADCCVEFDRAKARIILSERFTAAVNSQPAEHVRQLQQLLPTIGLQGRMRALPLADALEAVREGASLATSIAAPGESPAWIQISSASSTQACLAMTAGAEVWLTVDELTSLLERAKQGDTHTWLLAEPALPCSPDRSEGHSPLAESDHHGGEEAEHAAHMSPMRRLMALLRPELNDIWVVSLFSAIVSLLALATPVTVEALVNTVAFGRLMQPVIVLSLVLLACLGLAAAIRVLQGYIAEIIQRRLFVRVVADLSQRLPRVCHGAYEGSHGPELLNRFFDVMTVQKSAAVLVLDGIAIVLQTTVGMTVLVFYHPLLLGFNIFLLTSIAFAVFVLGRGGVATSIEESKAKYAVAHWLEQLASFPLTFKNAGGVDRAVERADQLAIDYLLARGSHFQVLLRQIAFMLALQALAGSVLLGIGGWLVIQGQLTLGQLVAAELIVALIVGSFAKMGKHLEAYYDLLAAVDKLGHLFDLPVEKQGGEPLAVESRGLTIEVGKQRIESGDFVALYGPPGSGKSQYLAAAFGLAHLSRDVLRINEVEVGLLELSTLRSQVALVRHGEVFAGSLAENVHLGRPAATRALVRASLEELGMREALHHLPAGLDTILQPSGIPLTDGQARCVVIARALFGEPRLLLIDSLLDGLPDEALPHVMAALARRSEKMTIVVATNRREIARMCPRMIEVSRADNSPLGSHSREGHAPTSAASLTH